MTESDLVTIQINPQLFWGLACTLGLLIGSVFVYFALPTERQGETPWVRYKKYTGLINVPEPLPELILLIWMTILALLITGLGWTIAQAAFGVTSADEIVTTVLFRLAGLTGVTGAVVAFPFTILRTQYNKRQTDAAEAALVNNKLDAAFAGLSARRKVTSRSREVVYMLNDTEYASTETPEELFELPEGAELIRRGPWQVISEEEDDIVTRSTAIDQLEGLAVEEPNQVARIVSILSLYVRELSREYPAEKMPDGMQEADDIWKWTNALKVKRPDMEKAAQTLGRLPKLLDNYDPEQIKTDFRSSNLQAFDLKELSFEHAAMEKAHLQGTNFRDTEMRRAGLQRAEMQGADFKHAKLQDADLQGAKMQVADLGDAKVQGADLRSAQMQGAICWGTEMQRADLKGADMQNAVLFYAQMQGADLRATAIDGASLFHTKIQGANLALATLRGTSVRSVDFTEVALAAQHWKDILGDPTTILPAGVDAPDHWPKFEMDWKDFEAEWERFKEDPAAYTPPDPPKDGAKT